MSSALNQAVSELCVPVPWGEIRGKVWGPDHGRPVLCLHGWADNCGTFDTLIPLLPKECRYVAIDMPGHGRSSHLPPGVSYSLLEYVVALRRVVEALKMMKFIILAHSMGSDMAGMFSALHPEMVDALVLLDGHGFIPTDSKELAAVTRQGIEEMIQFENKMREGEKRVYTYEKAVERLLTANPTLSEQAVHILLERGLKTVEGGFVFSRDIRVNIKNTVRMSLELSLEMQSRIQFPWLNILTDKGYATAVSERSQMKFFSTLVNGHPNRNHKVVMVPGDHYIHLNQPEVVAPIVSDFLRTKVFSMSSRQEHKL